MVKVKSEDVDLSLFNDDHEERPIFKREHMIHLEVIGIFGCSEQMFTSNMRNWEGAGDICYKAKTKKKMSYACRDIGEAIFSNQVIDDDTLTFKGTDSLPARRPTVEVKLYPINAEMRTIIG